MKRYKLLMCRVKDDDDVLTVRPFENKEGNWMRYADVEVLVAAARKLLNTFPEHVPDGDVEFNTPAYIVEELRKALEE